jgi:hypothetical protein
VDTYIKELLFNYVINSGSVGANSSTNKQLTFSSDSDFLLSEIRATGNSGINLQISLSNGQQFSSSAFATSLIGGANIPLLSFRLKVVIPKNTTMTFTFTNTTGGALTEEVQLWGYKI